MSIGVLAPKTASRSEPDQMPDYFPASKLQNESLSPKRFDLRSAAPFINLSRKQLAVLIEGLWLTSSSLLEANSN